MTEKDKMLKGLPFDSYEGDLTEERQSAKEKVWEYNQCNPKEIEKRDSILRSLLGKAGDNLFMEPPFYCDYGYNIMVGNNFYTNHNCVILDGAKVKIGNNVMFGPNVSLFAAGHPIHPEKRRAVEYVLPITIKDNVWIGGNTVINCNITIGENSVIGSGSVVTKDIPDNVVAVGNPCRVIKQITEEDKLYYYKDRKF